MARFAVEGFVVLEDFEGFALGFGDDEGAVEPGVGAEPEGEGGG